MKKQKKVEVDAAALAERYFRQMTMRYGLEKRSENQKANLTKLDQSA